MLTTGIKSRGTTLLALLLCASTACTSVRPITADASGEQVRSQLKPGDTVHVVAKSGASHTFKVTAIGATSLAGNTVKLWGVSSSEAPGTPIDIPYADIAEIDVRRVEGWKTFGLIAAVALAADVAVASSKAGTARCCVSSSSVSR